MTNLIGKFAGAFVAFGLAATPLAMPSAAAQTASETVSIRVPYADLDMTRAEGGVTLLKRMQGAAKKVCGPSKPYLRQQMLIIKCRREAIENAVRGANIGTLTLAWASKHSPTNLASR